MGISNFERHLGQVDPEEVLRYSTGSGLKKAQATFSAISQSTTGTTKAGDVLRGGTSPHLLGSSTKLEHNDTSGIGRVMTSQQWIQYLQPSTASGLKIAGATCNTCGSETKGCKGACLAGSGQLGLTGGHIAKQARTSFAIEEPAQYLGLLHAEIGAKERAANRAGRSPVIRLNGTSDVGWHRIPAGEVLIGSRPTTQFSEYTKFNTRDVVDREDPIPYDNYHIIHSITENTTVPRIRQITGAGRNVAVPFAVKKGVDIPDAMTLTDKQGRSIDLPVVKENRQSVGDLHDMRHLDRKEGGIVALRAKEITQGGRRGVFDTSGFIRPIQFAEGVSSNMEASGPSSRLPQSVTPVNAPRRRSR